MTDEEAEEIIRRLKLTKEERRMSEIEDILRHSSPYEPGNYEIGRLETELVYLKKYIIKKGNM